MKYLIVLERAPHNWCAYAPDVWGCVAAADTREETTRMMREALALHFRGTREDNLPIPRPGTWSALVQVRAPADVSSGAEGVTLQYPVVLEQAEPNWSAFVPDVGGCIATAPTREAVIEKIASALEFHFEGMRDAGLPIPPPGAWTAVVDVDVPVEALGPAC